jgi:TetR/AcrR family transcriptional regulator, cholesterol catabolism regulator
VCDSGRGDAVNVQLQAYSIVAIGTHMASWYQPTGPLSLDDVVRAYTGTILRQLNVHAAAARNRPDATLRIGSQRAPG